MYDATRTRRRPWRSDSELVADESDNRRQVRVSDDVVSTVGIVRVVVGMSRWRDRTLHTAVNRAAFWNN